MFARSPSTNTLALSSEAAARAKMAITLLIAVSGDPTTSVGFATSSYRKEGLLGRCFGPRVCRAGYSILIGYQLRILVQGLAVYSRPGDRMFDW